MISVRENGRISGPFIVRRLLSQRLIYAGPEDISWKAPRHTVRGLQFSPDLKSDLEILEDLRNAAKNVLYLYYFAEEQAYLNVPFGEAALPFRETLHGEDITGITLLQMISDGRIRVHFDDEETELYAEPEFLSAVPEARELLRNLIRTVYLFSGEPGPKRILVREKADADTRELSSGLSISYGADSWDSDIPGAGLAYLYMADEELPSDEPVQMTGEQESALQAFSQMMEELDEASRRTGENSARFELRFDERRSLEYGGCTVAVPDGFLISPEECGPSRIIWLPNQENPEEWEASLFCLRVERKPEAAAGEMPPLKMLDGQTLRMTRVFGSGEDRLVFECRMPGVTEENLASAENAAKTLFRTISQ